MNKATRVALEWLQSDYDLRGIAQETTRGLLSTGEGTMAVSLGLEDLLYVAVRSATLKNPFMTHLFLEGFRNVDFSAIAEHFVLGYQRLLQESPPLPHQGCQARQIDGAHSASFDRDAQLLANRHWNC